MINITETSNFDIAMMVNNTAAPIDYQREYVQSVARALREFSFVMQSSQVRNKLSKLVSISSKLLHLSGYCAIRL